jgi:hypothetical protein
VYIPIDRNPQLDVISFADDLALLASTEDGLQRSIYNFHTVASKTEYADSNREVESDDVPRKEPVLSKFC